jgi:hypothetical protein
VLIGNPNLAPEKIINYEIGLQGAISQNLTSIVSIYNKDMDDLIGTRLVKGIPYYITYFNVEHADAKGIETIVEYAKGNLCAKVSYTLSWAKGTSSYANEVYQRYYFENPDTNFVPPATEYYLDFDQRHRFFIQGSINLTKQTTLYVFTFLGNGFPYTPPGPEGKYGERNIVRLPFQKMIDCVALQKFKIGRLSACFNLEVINLLDERYVISYRSTTIQLDDVDPWDFNDYYALDNHDYYHPAADLNHDGLICPWEEYTAFRNLIIATSDWISAYTSPRRARIGVTFNF